MAAGVGIVGVIGAQAAPETAATAEPVLVQPAPVQAPTSAAPAPTRTVIIQIPASAITGGVATEATTVVIGGTATDTIAPAEPAPREPVAETKGS